MENQKIIEVSSVDLGFLQKKNPSLLTNRYFPSKVGGKPAWLELTNLPKYEEIECAKCKNPRIFLCQIYAPIETRDDCFHRTIFIFICENKSCFELNKSDNIVVFRSQLPRANNFYSFKPPAAPEINENTEVKGPLNLCHLCGCRGDISCSSCENIHYCSEIHQKSHWKKHQLLCNKKEKTIFPSIKLFLPEYEITMDDESEIYSSSESTDSEEIGLLNERILDFNDYLKRYKPKLQNVPESELSKYVEDAGNFDDEQFAKFKHIVENAPAQVIRYERNGDPLWLTCKNIVDENSIPNCEYCNSQRKFEFQIMPQMLNYLENDKLDWGILAIYTCSQSCNTNSQYVKEYVVKQDIV